MEDWIFGFAGGLLIGLAAATFLLVNGRIMGASGIIGGVLEAGRSSEKVERLVFLAALVSVPALLNLLSGATSETGVTAPSPVIILAGLLVGLGTRVGSGCTSGHGVCGISRLSLRGIVATCLYIGAGALTVAIFSGMFGGNQ